MVNESAEKYRHFILEGVTETEDYLSPQQYGGRPDVPKRNRGQHGTALQRQVEEIRQSIVTDGEGLGIQVEFESLIHDYLAEKRDSIGRARDNRRLIDAIQHIRSATVKALWTDVEEFPSQEDDLFWWEVWIRIPIRHEWRAAVADFRERAAARGMRVAQGEVIFPERGVLLVNSSVTQMQDSMLFLNHVAELKRAKDTAEFFDSMTISGQREWLDDLLSRTVFVSDGQRVPYVCLLDTGVNRGHPLLEPALHQDDVHTVDPNWGTEDANGHGMSMIKS